MHCVHSLFIGYYDYLNINFNIYNDNIVSACICNYNFTLYRITIIIIVNLLI